MKSKRKNNTENVKGGSTDPHPKTTLVKVVIHQQKILKVEIAFYSHSIEHICI